MARNCSRPLCGKDAQAVLLFSYDDRHVVLDWAPSDHDPNLLELCSQHADRFSPPNGWTVEDDRGGPGSLLLPGRRLLSDAGADAVARVGPTELFVPGRSARA
jgi:hypothetical protein